MGLLFGFVETICTVTALLVGVLVAFLLFVDSDLCLKFAKDVPENGFEGKVVWIAGASSGIGAQLAKDLTRRKAQVIISARRMEQLEEVAKECCEKFKGCKAPFVVHLDILQEDSRQLAFKTIIEKFGRIDILVLNAGRGQRSLAVDTPLELTREIMELNFFSFVAVTNLVLPTMITNKQGQIVVLSSISGKVCTPIAGVYSASKFALHGYFDAVRSEVSLHNVVVSVVCPGPTESEFGQHRLEAGDHTHTKETKKMPVEYFSALMTKGIYHGLEEMTISRQPMLLLTLLSSHFPWLSRQLFTRLLGPSRVRIMRDGGDPYDIKLLLGLKKSNSGSSTTTASQ